jgi:hypothetical protein
VSTWKSLVLTPVLSAICGGFLTVQTHAESTDCELNNIALGRVITTEPTLHFMAGPSKHGPSCPSAEAACKLKAYLVPGDEVLVGAADGPYVCASFKSDAFVQTTGWLPRAALQLTPPEAPSVRQWDGKWRADADTEIVVKSHGNEVMVSGTASWGGSDPERVKSGAVHTGEIDGKGKPQGHILAIGYDPDKSGFPPPEAAAPDVCAARLNLYGRYLMVEDNGKCGGLNVSFTGLYVRVSQK